MDGSGWERKREGGIHALLCVVCPLPIVCHDHGQGEGGADEEEEIPENLSEEEYLQLKKTAKESTKKVKELQDKLMRCLAEQENARVRYQREVRYAQPQQPTHPNALIHPSIRQASVVCSCV